MQFFGLQNNSLFSALCARKKEIYICPECGGTLKLRSGPKRHPHFYHLSPPKNCSQHAKSLYHLQTQLYLCNKLPQGESAMEHPFPSIGRIADLVWTARKIVFEVQYSPISKEEVENRCADYESLGLTVIWILHDIRFNKKSLSAAEFFLRARGCYFSNISKTGSGFLYDQFERIQEERRFFKSRPLPIQISQPLRITSELSLPDPLKQRTFAFSGDLLDRYLKKEGEFPFETLPPKRDFIKKILYQLKKGYQRLFLAILRPLTKEAPFHRPNK